MKRLLALLPLPLALLVRLWARHTPETVERLFSQGVYPALAAPVSRAAALCPVPVFGLGVLALLGYILWSLRQGRWFRVLAVLGLAAALAALGPNCLQGLAGVLIGLALGALPVEPMRR